MNAPANIGSNRPALITTEDLARDHKHVVESIAEIEQNVASAPPFLEDAEDAEIVTGLMKRLIGAAKRVDEIRVGEKEVYLVAGRTVDGFFNGFRDRLDKAKRGLQPRLDNFLQKKALAERRIREAAEQKAREEAERARQELAATANTGDGEKTKQAIEAAAVAQRQADDAATAAQARPADLARTQTSAGTASLAVVWDFKIENHNTIDLEKLRPYLSPADLEKAIRIYVRQGGRELRGVKIFSVEKTVIR